MEASPLDLLETAHDAQFREAPVKIFSFGEGIECQRKVRRLTQAQAAKLVQVTVSTWNRWKSGKVVPPQRTQEAVLKLLESGRAAPAPRRRKALQKSHHLYWEKHKGWFLRLTINVGSKIVGKRVKVRLYTHDEEAAKRNREIVMASYRRLGVTFATRIHRPMKGRGASAGG